MRLLLALFEPLVRLLAWRNLRADRFGALAAIVGVALGTATVNVVLILDVSTAALERRSYVTNPALPIEAARTVSIQAFRADGAPIQAEDAHEETHEDYEIMRALIRLGSLSAFLVGALIVFFTFAVAVERRRREVALLRSLGAQPRQVQAVLLREALLIGIAGAALGLAASIPLGYLAAKGGITTTGRSRIPLKDLALPIGPMLLTAALGALTALLGVIRPAREARRVDVSRALRPRFMEGDAAGAEGRPRRRGLALVALPFARLLGASLGALLGARRMAAERLLLERRIERTGHALSWSVSGIMLVFALLLGLHLATHALKAEVSAWGARALAPYAFLYPDEAGGFAARVEGTIPARVAYARFSGRTPWPNAALAVPADELVALAEATGRPEAVAAARALGPGKVLVSSMMARRFHVGAGDLLELDGRAGRRRFEVAAVTDDIGYVPAAGAYRNLRTYALLDASDFPILSPYAQPIGHSIALADPVTGRVAPGATPPWEEIFAGVPRSRDVARKPGPELEALRRKATGRDFVIFDMILVFTTVLAGIGVANQMVLAVHARRRELALYRALGMTAGQIRRLLMLEGGLAGALGGALAVLLGIPIGALALAALRTVSAFEVELSIPPEYPALTALGAVAVSLVASIYPAAAAAKADAAESVHYE